MLVTRARVLAVAFLAVGLFGSAGVRPLPAAEAPSAAPDLTLPLAVDWQFYIGPTTLDQAPVAESGRVYVAAGASLVSLDAGSGRPLWTLAYDDALRSPPAARFDFVYVGGPDGYLRALDAQSLFQGDQLNVLWQFPEDHSRGAFRTAVTMAGNSLYAATFDNIVYAVDRRTGTEQWSTPSDDTIQGEMAVDGDNLYATDQGAFLSAYRRTDGRLAWRRQLPLGSEASDPAAGRDRVAVTVGNALLVFHRGGGLLWKYEHAGGALTPPAIAEPPGAAAEPPSSFRRPAGVVYVGSADGFVMAFDAETGRQLWRHEAGASLTSRPAVTPTLLFFGARGPFVVALARADGTPRWMFWDRPPELVAGEESDTDVLATPVVSGGALYVLSGSGYLTRFSSGAVDKAPPDYDLLKPTPGSTVTERSFDLSVVLFDADSGVDASTLVMTLDGKAVPVVFDPRKGKVGAQVVNTADAALPVGWHRAEVRAKDYRGNELVRGWYFSTTTPSAAAPKPATPARPR